VLHWTSISCWVIYWGFNSWTFSEIFIGRPFGRWSKLVFRPAREWIRWTSVPRPEQISASLNL